MKKMYFFAAACAFVLASMTSCSNSAESKCTCPETCDCTENCHEGDNCTCPENCTGCNETAEQQVEEALQSGQPVLVDVENDTVINQANGAQEVQTEVQMSAE